MPYLRGSGGVIAIFVLIHEVVRLCCLCGVHLLNLGKRLVHAPKSHLHAVNLPAAVRFTLAEDHTAYRRYRLFYL